MELLYIRYYASPITCAKARGGHCLALQRAGVWNLRLSALHDTAAVAWKRWSAVGHARPGRRGGRRRRQPGAADHTLTLAEGLQTPAGPARVRGDARAGGRPGRGRGQPAVPASGRAARGARGGVRQPGLRGRRARACRQLHPRCNPSPSVQNLVLSTERSVETQVCEATRARAPLAPPMACRNAHPYH